MAARIPLAQRRWLAEPPRREHREHREQADAQQQRQQRDLQLHPPRADQHRHALAGDGAKPEPGQRARERERADVLDGSLRHGDHPGLPCPVKPAMRCTAGSWGHDGVLNSSLRTGGSGVLATESEWLLESFFISGSIASAMTVQAMPAKPSLLNSAV